jgi:formyltetrahydrofolate deformylase
MACQEDQKMTASNDNLASYVLTTECPDATGIVAAVTSFIASQNGLITESAHFRDPYQDRSLMRTEFRGADLPPLDELERKFSILAGPFQMRWNFFPSGQRPRTLIAVSKQGHCLNSILHRWSMGVLPVDIVGIVSNHTAQEKMAGWYEVPYHYLPLTRETKSEQEGRLLEVFEGASCDLLVLARYMQVLSSSVCKKLRGRCINIHHSFLPGFKGARPYHRAYARGVKIIGATAHYVTEDLDEGPIIEQAVERVDHAMNPDKLMEIGHDLESVVLLRAIRWHAEHRVFQSGPRTVILRA